MKTIDANNLKHMLSSESKPTLVNTLPADSFEETRIPRSINIPQDQQDFAERVEQAIGSRDEPVVVYCASRQCDSSTKAAHKLEEAGFSQVYDFEAGTQGWEGSGEKLQTGGA